MENNKTIKLKLIPLASLLSIALVLSGCGGAALKKEFRDISEAHASLSDEQMLLNLARRANSNTTHFLQMSSVNASFSFGATLGTSTATSDTLSAMFQGIVTRLLSFTGTLGLSASETPTFSFAPLGGATFAQSAYRPIDNKVFFEQLGQGVPVNQLMRILLVSVVLDYPSGKRLVLNNSTPHQAQPNNYRDFLRLAGLTRQLQLNNVLRVEVVNDQNVLTMPREAVPLLSKLYTSPEYSFWESGLTQVEVSDGIPKVSFVMRSFDGVLGALGQSQRLYDQWLSKGQKLSDIPESERQPGLRLQWDENEHLTPSVVKVKYLEGNYQIADLDDNRYSTWNRDSFRILNDLFTIVSLDPKEMPIQQLIKVN